MAWQFEQVVAPSGAISEGPAWDGRYLYFSLIEKSLIMRYDPETGGCIAWARNTGRTNGLAFDAKGNLYGCSVGKQAIVRFDQAGQMTVVADQLDGQRLNTPNDLAIDSKGRIWFTNPWNGEITEPGQQRGMADEPVLRADPREDGSYVVTRVATDTSNPNGILISPDERTLYVSQCDYGVGQLRELRAYPIDDQGALGPYVVLHTFGQDHRGVHRAIDGMCFDADGNIVATAGWPVSGPGPMIYVFSPSGQVLETHPFPASRPSNCTFGDRDMKTLYLTSGGLKDPSAGQLFRARLSRPGWNLFPPAPKQ